jgi:prefoldin subunit 5
VFETKQLRAKVTRLEREIEELKAEVKRLTYIKEDQWVTIKHLRKLEFNRYYE